MCTIFTTDRTLSEKLVIERMITDSEHNTDGMAMLAVLKNGKPFFVQSLDVSVLVALVETLDWSRIFVHARASTQGETSLQNCHGWNSEGVYVFHNGYIGAKVARRFAVDSEAIKYWLDSFGVEETLIHLQYENFANVFLVDINTGTYHVHRSTTGTLYTDTNGNYSTNAVGDICLPVDTFTSNEYVFEVSNQGEKYGADIYSYGDWRDDWKSETADELLGWDTWSIKGKKSV